MLTAEQLQRIVFWLGNMSLLFIVSVLVMLGYGWYNCVLGR